jgi:hypothetical protein
MRHAAPLGYSTSPQTDHTPSPIHQAGAVVALGALVLITIVILFVTVFGVMHSRYDFKAIWGLGALGALIALLTRTWRLIYFKPVEYDSEKTPQTALPRKPIINPAISNVIAFDFEEKSPVNPPEL